MNRILISILMIALSACVTEENPSQDQPNSLEAKKEILVEKRQELKALEAQIEELEAEIAETEPQAIQLKKVTTRHIESKDVSRFVEIQGSIVADDIVVASSEIGGRIINVFAEEGDYIRRGSLIAKVDMESMRKQIQEVEKALELAQEVYSRQQRLWSQNIGSELQYLQAKNEKERLEKSLETFNFNLSKANVYAPISGVVEQALLKPGEMASPGAPIVQILNTNKLKVSIDVPEKYLKSIEKGSKIRIQIPTLEYEQLVRVTDIGRIIDPGNRTFKVEARISNRDRKLKPNLMVIAFISDFKADDVIAIASDLVQQEINGSNYVYIIDRDTTGLTKAHKRYIQIGESVENELVITDGLFEGDELILEGSRLINDQQLVQIVNMNTEG